MLLDDGKRPVLMSKFTITRLIIRHVHIRTLHDAYRLSEKWKFNVAFLACVFTPHVYLEEYLHCLLLELIVDYAGHIMVKFGSERGHRTHKAYIAVFVYLYTRTIHLE